MAGNTKLMSSLIFQVNCVAQYCWYFQVKLKRRNRRILPMSSLNEMQINASMTVSHVLSKTDHLYSKCLRKLYTKIFNRNENRQKVQTCAYKCSNFFQVQHISPHGSHNIQLLLLKSSAFFSTHSLYLLYAG